MFNLPAGFKVIPGFPDYAVSGDGEVCRATPGHATAVGRILKTHVDRHGYMAVTIRDKEQRQAKLQVHRLMALTFFGPAPSARHEVAHGDGVRTNNILSNLRWATHEENCADRADHGNWHVQRGSEHHQAKLDEVAVARIKLALEGGVSGRHLASLHGVTPSRISEIRNGKAWSHVAA